MISRIHTAMVMDTLVDAFYDLSEGQNTLIDMGRGISSFNPLPLVDVKLSDADLYSTVAYGELRGLALLREQICHQLEIQTGSNVTPNRIIITAGATEALLLALSLMLTEPGEVIIPRYYYPAYPGMIEVFGGKCCYVDVDENFCLDVNTIKAAVTSSTRGIIVNNPSNPFGTILTAQELDELADLGVPVIFDEVYGKLELEKEIETTTALRHSDRHYLVNSFSKSLGIAGFRLGYLIAPVDRIPALVNAKAVLSICASVPSQVIGCKLITSLGQLQAEHRRFLSGNWKLLAKSLKLAGIKLKGQPQAGYFANIDLSEYDVSPLDLSQRLVENYGLCTTPCDDFYYPGANNTPDRSIRINFACSPSQIQPAISRLSSCLADI